MQHSLGIQPRGGLDVCIHERVVALVSDSLVAVPQVERVVQQALAVGADVEHQRDHAVRVDAGRGGIHDKFTDRDGDPSNTPITNTQDLLRIGGDDQVHIVCPGPEIVERCFDRLRLIDRQVHAARAPVILAVALDRRSDRRRIDDRQHLPQVLRHQPVEQHFVAVVKRGERNVFAHVVRLALILGVRSTRLIGQRQHCRRQQARQAQLLALFGSERRAAIQEWRGQHVEATCAYLQDGAAWAPPDREWTLTQPQLDHRSVTPPAAEPAVPPRAAHPQRGLIHCSGRR